MLLLSGHHDLDEKSLLFSFPLIGKVSFLSCYFQDFSLFSFKKFDNDVGWHGFPWVYSV